VHTPAGPGPAASTQPSHPAPGTIADACANAKSALSGVQGRPKDGPEDKFRLAPVAPRLQELLGTTVTVIQDCIGNTVAEAVAAASNGSVCPAPESPAFLCPPRQLLLM
jgi:3-phosphoglycerate kinase